MRFLFYPIIESGSLSQVELEKNLFTCLFSRKIMLHTYWISRNFNKMETKNEDKNSIVAQNLTNDTKDSISYSRSHWHYAILVDQSTRIVFFFFCIPMAKLFDRFFSREIARAETAIARDSRYDNSTRETLKFFSSSNNSLHCDIYLFFFRIFCFHVYLCYNSRSSYRYQFIIKKFFSIFLYSMLNDPEEGVHLTRSRWRHLSNLSWITLTAQRNQI